jgi:L-threonylcarbamoyladenylate synthase
MFDCLRNLLKKIFEIKKRPFFNPLIVHIDSIESLDKVAKNVPEQAYLLAQHFWPGPLTMIFEKNNTLSNIVTANKNTVAVRIPDHPIALELIKEVGIPLAAPSANRFGHVSPTTAQAVKDELGSYLNEQDQILDGGPCTVGVESTIIDCTGDVPKILRPGAITAEMITASTGLEALDSTGTLIRTSGSLDAHYAPAAQVLLDQQPKSGQGFIALATTTTPEDVIRLASPNNDVEFAQILYASLRKADELGLSHVVIEQPTGSGIAVAIRDRLMRAANGR